MRAFVELWDEITRERYGVQDPKMRRFRYGVQVNSLGLTEAQPENNVQRIVLEMLGVTLSKDARARAVQLPAWNEALGLPRPWDQQWSLRLQQVLAFESDLLEYDDIFDGSHVIEAKVAELVPRAQARRSTGSRRWAARSRRRSGYMKQELVSAHAARRARIESGEESDRRRQQLRDHRALAADRRPRRRDPDRRPRGRAGRARAACEAWKAQRDEAEVAERARRAGRGREDRRQPDGATLVAARAGATTGEWAGTLREVFGEFRAPTGVSAAPWASPRPPGRRAPSSRRSATGCKDDRRGAGQARLRLLVGKPGLDGHSNGAEQVAVRARDAGFEVDLPGHPAHARADRRRRPSPRTCTASGSRSCPARTWSWSRRCSTGSARPGWATSR